MSYDRENERARGRSAAFFIAALTLVAFAGGVLFGGMPYARHVDYWQLALFMYSVPVALACVVVGFVILERDTSRLRRIGDELRARRGQVTR